MVAVLIDITCPAALWLAPQAPASSSEPSVARLSIWPARELTLVEAPSAAIAKGRCFLRSLSLNPPICFC